MAKNYLMHGDVIALYEHLRDRSERGELDHKTAAQVAEEVRERTGLQVTPSNVRGMRAKLPEHLQWRQPGNGAEGASSPVANRPRELAAALAELDEAVGGALPPARRRRVEQIAGRAQGGGDE